MEIMNKAACCCARSDHMTTRMILADFYSIDYGPVHISVIDQYVAFSPVSPQHIWLQNDLANTQNGGNSLFCMNRSGVPESGMVMIPPPSKILVPLFEQHGVDVVMGDTTTILPAASSPGFSMSPPARGRGSQPNPGIGLSECCYSGG